jgi:hypothetical protein
VFKRPLNKSEGVALVCPSADHKTITADKKVPTTSREASVPADPASSSRIGSPRRLRKRSSAEVGEESKKQSSRIGSPRRLRKRSSAEMGEESKKQSSRIGSPRRLRKRSSAEMGEDGAYSPSTARSPSKETERRHFETCLAMLLWCASPASLAAKLNCSLGKTWSQATSSI